MANHISTPYLLPVMPYEELPDLAKLSLLEIADLAKRRKLPPVESWQPENSSDSHMRIATNGDWYHQGGLISRPAMVRAFLSILRREEDGSYWLVTPHYKQSIIVEDAPFKAIEMEVRGKNSAQSLAFRLNDDDIVIASADHPLRFQCLDSQPRPYIVVRGGMEARLTRSVFYRLVELAKENDDGSLGIWSEGYCFPLKDSATFTDSVKAD